MGSDHAKAYARFCRIHGFFLVDGIGPWRAALRARGISEIETDARIAAAAELVRRMADPLSDRQGA